MTARAGAGALVAVASRPRGGLSGLLFAAALGAAAATASTAGTYYLRSLANRRLGGGRIANLITGAIEDALAVACGRALTRRG
jgi:hypothetical protein